ncbi:MAG: GTP 3',8-cyclase MoaA [Hyphomonadaceae bacterium]|nr:GTP 3',8-cyclase MoaA [Hyphomonadaceae bacterium]
MTSRSLIDSFQRRVSYLRVSVTDRCDLRCAYCMPERMTFLPKADVLSLEELDRLVSAFVRRGVRKVRLTGGEPLGRRDLLFLVERLSRFLGADLDEITLTTNGTQLKRFAQPLFDAGMRRINVSLDTLDAATFARIARRDVLGDVLAGIDAAQGAGLHVKLNVVALKDDNAREIPELIRWGHARGHDVCLIETMPLGEIEAQRTDQYLPLSQVRAELESFWRLTDISDTTGGPARYVRVEETGGRLGFITPLTHNFCESCNRVRVTCTGRLYTCLGRDDGADLRAALRASPDDGLLDAAIDEAIRLKPKGHDFVIERKQPAVARHMSTTGG